MREHLNTHTTVLAIDPGMSGAVAAVGRGRVEVVRDFKEHRDIVVGIVKLCRDASCAVIEHVHAMPGQGVSSMFSFGKSTGVALGALLAHNITPYEVSPQKWQNFYRERFKLDRATHPQFDSRSLLAALLPEYASLVKRKKDHNTADAVLIGLWKLAVTSIE